MGEPTAVPVCPKCGAAMVVRKRRTDGQPFWGCSQFPQCRFILNIAPTGPSQPPAYPTAVTIPTGPQPNRLIRSRFHRPEWLAFAFGAVSAVCAMGIVAAGGGRATYWLCGGLLLMFTAVSLLGATIAKPSAGVRATFKVMGLSLFCAFGLFGLIPLCEWLGQIVGGEFIRAIPTVPHPTSSIHP